MDTKKPMKIEAALGPLFPKVARDLESLLYRFGVGFDPFKLPARNRRSTRRSSSKASAPLP